MSEIKEKQKVNLLFNIIDGSEKEIECSIKKLDNDRISLNFNNEALKYAESLQEGEDVTVKIFTPLGIKVFDAVIINSPLEEDFVIEYSEDATHVQRREYARVLFITKVIIQRKNCDNIITQTIDISGGGLRFFHQGIFLPNEKVNVMLYLPYQPRSIKAEAIVLVKNHIPKGQHVILFTKIEEFERDKIIKQCFDIQREKISTVEED